jgi:hypothetical protein
MQRIVGHLKLPSLAASVPAPHGFLSEGTISDLRRLAGHSLMGEWRNGKSCCGTRPTAFDLPNISEEFGTERGARRTAGYAGR